MRPTLTYILPDSMGGVFTYVKNLLASNASGYFETYAVMTRPKFETAGRPGCIGADHEIHLGHQLPKENLYAVARRLMSNIPKGPGVVVTNDFLELATFSIYDPGKMVVMLMHGDYGYYYDLAHKHANIIDYFVASSQHMAAKLRGRLPERSDTILQLPYGVSVPPSSRTPHRGPLRAIFIGRLTELKGCLDLPVIDLNLRDQGVAVEWTIVGSGPDEKRMSEAWTHNPMVRWTGALPNDVTRNLLLENDIFVLPSKYEGFPVTLLEAAAAGVVPVTSDLPSGIPEVVVPGRTGFRIPVADTRGFANAIAILAADREMLEKMSSQVRALAIERFDICKNIQAYEQLYEKFSEPRVNRRALQSLKYGSRLDQPWIPNFAVKAIRAVTRRDL